MPVDDAGADDDDDEEEDNDDDDEERLWSPAVEQFTSWVAPARRWNRTV